MTSGPVRLLCLVACMFYVLLVLSVHVMHSLIFRWNFEKVGGEYDGIHIEKVGGEHDGIHIKKVGGEHDGIR